MIQDTSITASYEDLPRELKELAIAAFREKYQTIEQLYADIGRDMSLLVREKIDSELNGILSELELTAGDNIDINHDIEVQHGYIDGRINFKGAVDFIRLPYKAEAMDIQRRILMVTDRLKPPVLTKDDLNIGFVIFIMKKFGIINSASEISFNIKYDPIEEEHTAVMLYTDDLTRDIQEAQETYGIEGLITLGENNPFDSFMIMLDTLVARAEEAVGTYLNNLATYMSKEAEDIIQSEEMSDEDIIEILGEHPELNAFVITVRLED